MSIQPNPSPRTEDDRPDTWGSILGAIIIGVACLFGLVKMGQCLGGCVPTTAERTAASVVGIAANQGRPILVAGWAQAALACVNANATRPEADVCIAGIDAKYEPIWYGYDLLKAAHDLYRTKIAAGQTPAVTDLQPAYCAFRGLAAKVYSFPDFPGQPCPVAGQPIVSNPAPVAAKQAAQPITPKTTVTQ